MAAVLESTACDEGGEVGIAVAAGVAHAGAEQDDGVIEEGAAFRVFLFLQLLQESGEAVDVGGLDGDEILDHLRIVAVMREAVIAGAEGLALKGEDLAESVKEECHHTGGVRFQCERHEVVEDGLGLDLEIGRDGVVVGQFVVRLGDGIVERLELAAHAFFDGAKGFKVLVELVAVALRQGFLQAQGVLENEVERAASALEQVLGAGAVGLGEEELFVEDAGALNHRQADTLAGEAHRFGNLTCSGGELDGREARFLTDLVGDALVERVRFRGGSAEEIAPSAVAVGGAVVEAGEDGESVALLGEGREGGWHLVVASDLPGEEGVLMPAEPGADGDEVLGLGGGFRGCGEGFERGQGDRGQRAAQEEATIHFGVVEGGDRSHGGGSVLGQGTHRVRRF